MAPTFDPERVALAAFVAAYCGGRGEAFDRLSALVGAIVRARTTAILTRKQREVAELFDEYAALANAAIFRGLVRQLHGPN